MKLHEIFDTNLPIKWSSSQTEDIGFVYINNEEIRIIIQKKHYKPKNIGFLNVAFERRNTNNEFTQDTINKNKNTLSIFGAVINASLERLKHYSVDAITFIATENIDKRMRVYNTIAKKIGGNVLYNIKIQGGLLTIIFSKTFPKEAFEEFKAYITNMTK